MTRDADLPPRVSKIEGKITTEDGVTREFFIGVDAGWSQWGEDQVNLGNTSEAIDVMATALADNDLLVSDSDEEDGS